LVLRFTTFRLNVDAVKVDEIRDAWLIISNIDKMMFLKALGANEKCAMKPN